MVTTLVVNASPLISLGKSGLLWLLEADSFAVRIPDAVAREVLAKPSDAAAQWLMTSGAAFRVQAFEFDPLLLAWDLGAGETSVIALGAVHGESVVLLDDLAARRCAQALGLRCTGTLGLILMSKARGLIPAALPCVHALREHGLYISDSLLRAVRDAAGE